MVITFCAFGGWHAFTRPSRTGTTGKIPKPAVGRHVRRVAGTPHGTRPGQHAYPWPVAIALLQGLVTAA